MNDPAPSSPVVSLLDGRLIVSCQAPPGDPMRDTGTLVRLARAAAAAWGGRDPGQRTRGRRRDLRRRRPASHRAVEGRGHRRLHHADRPARLGRRRGGCPHRRHRRDRAPQARRRHVRRRRGGGARRRGPGDGRCGDPRRGRRRDRHAARTSCRPRCPATFPAPRARTVPTSIWWPRSRPRWPSRSSRKAVSAPPKRPRWRSRGVRTASSSAPRSPHPPR